MAHELGIKTKIEDYMAAVLVALQSDGKDIFKKAEPWSDQLTSLAESVLGKSPFAYVGSYSGPADRAGDFDLTRNLQFSILIGLQYKQPGVARRGDATHIGAGTIEELVIAALDKKHPGGNLDCDDMEYQGSEELLDTGKKYIFQMNFKTKRSGS
jgi:hypothetical protein